MPKTKIIILTCNPVQRAFRAYIEFGKNLGLFESKDKSDFENFVKDSVPVAERILESKGYSDGFKLNGLNSFHEVYYDSKVKITLQNTTVDAKVLSILFRGFYEPYLSWWKDSFNDVLELKYEVLKDSPWLVTQKVEDFVGVHRYLTEKVFQRENTTGFYCYLGPSEKSCENMLGEQKKRTRSFDSDFLLGERENHILDDFYKKYTTMNDEFCQQERVQVQLDSYD